MYTGAARVVFEQARDRIDHCARTVGGTRRGCDRRTAGGEFLVDQAVIYGGHQRVQIREILCPIAIDQPRLTEDGPDRRSRIAVLPEQIEACIDELVAALTRPLCRGLAVVI